MYENPKHTVIKHLTKKIKTYSHFQTVTINNSKHFFRFHIKQYDNFRDLLPNDRISFISSSTRTVKELLPNKSKHIFSFHIKHYWHFQGVAPKQYYTHFQTSNNTDIFRELLANNTNFSRFHIIIKQYWYFQRVTVKQYCTLIRSLYQTIVAFLESSFQIKL